MEFGISQVGSAWSYESIAVKIGNQWWNISIHSTSFHSRSYYSRTNSLSSLALCRFRAALGHTQQDRTYLTQQDISLSTRSIHHISSLLGLLTLQPGAYLYYQEDTVLIQDLEITQFETTCSSIHSITLLIRDYDISGSIIGGTQYLFKTQRL